MFDLNEKRPMTYLKPFKLIGSLAVYDFAIRLDQESNKILQNDKAFQIMLHEKMFSFSFSKKTENEDHNSANTG